MTNFNPNNQNVPIYGLVLIGGKSKRMGVDKGTLKIDDQELRISIYHVLKNHVQTCFFSGKANQKEALSSYPFITDEIHDMGPFGALLTAFKNHPNVCWLVVACDMALLKDDILNELITSRDESQPVTVFTNSKTGFYEIMPSLWEPSAYELLLKQQQLGNDSLQRIIKTLDIRTLHSKYEEQLFNMNTPDDAKSIGVQDNGFNGKLKMEN